MKRIIILITIIYLNIFAVYEIAVFDSQIAGMGEAVGAVNVGNSFVINPANLNFNDKMIFSFKTSIGNISLVDSFEMAGTLFSRFLINKNFGIGAFLDYDLFTYSGGFVRIAGSSLWSEKKIGVSMTYKFNNMFRLGMLIKTFSFSSDAIVETIDFKTKYSFDTDVGLLFVFKKIQLGLSINNLVSLNNYTERKMRLGSVFKIGEFISILKDNSFAADFEYILGSNKLNIYLGDEYIFSNIITFRIGLNSQGIIDNIKPSLGMTYKLKNISFSYSAIFNFIISSLGEHNISIDYRL